MSIIVSIAAALFLFLAGIVCFGLFRGKRKSFSDGRGYNPFVSVIIPARNEAPNLPVLFRSLLVQSYSNFEVILIDDRSEDGSLELMKAFKAEADFSVKVIKSEDLPGDENPKVRVLLKGIKEAEGEIFLLTDADCEASPEWVSLMIKPFSSGDTGIVCGLLSLDQNNTLLGLFQNFDHFYRMFYAFAAIGINKPIGCFGNNMAVRRETYEKAGGYEDLLHSATEDAELISRAAENGAGVRAIFNKGTFIRTVPKYTWREHSEQAARWAAGAVFSGNPLARLGFFALMLIVIFCLSGIILGFAAGPVLFVFPVIMYLFLIISAVLFGLFGSVNKAYWRGFFPSVFLYPLVYVESFIRIIVMKRVYWKGTEISWSRRKKRNAET